MNLLRAAISENRKRYIDKDINLDLSYITNNIIAMSYPSNGVEGLYRNPYVHVKKFLDDKHASHYKVYNLRTEKQYELSRFENAANFPFNDHQAPPFSTLTNFCTDAADWLEKDSENIIAVHCKAGKGRTGTVIAALLLHLGQAKDADEAMMIYAKERTDNTKGVTIPSQRRYVHYYDFMLKHKALYEENKDINVHLIELSLHHVPQNLGKQFVLEIFDIENNCLYSEDSSKLDKKWNDKSISVSNLKAPALKDDFQVLFRNGRGKKLLSFWLNSCFIYIQNANLIHLNKQVIDIAFHDKSHKIFDASFSINIKFSA